MGTYKVLQDIEAEDKLLGPLTLKQFIFTIITLTCAYLSFMALTRGAGFLIVFLFPPMLIFGFLAFPWSREQSTEVWLLAKLRFIVKPRKRIWDQNGLKDLVTVTAPVVEKKNYTNGLSQGEVKSRLNALANTIDSRGWAVKNVNVNMFAQSQYNTVDDSDRLLDPRNLPQEVSNSEVTLSDDILDERNNRTAQNLDRMIHATSAAHRQQLLEQMKQGGAPATDQPQPDYWFLNQTNGPVPAGQAVFNNASPISPGGTDPTGHAAVGPPAADEQALLTQLHNSQSKGTAAYGHMRTIDPMGATVPASTQPAQQAQASVSSKQPTSPATPNPVILELANNDDLNVATLARQANKNQEQELADDEVVISLH